MNAVNCQYLLTVIAHDMFLILLCKPGSLGSGVLVGCWARNCSRSNRKLLERLCRWSTISTIAQLIRVPNKTLVHANEEAIAPPNGNRRTDVSLVWQSLFCLHQIQGRVEQPEIWARACSALAQFKSCCYCKLLNHVWINTLIDILCLAKRYRILTSETGDNVLYCLTWEKPHPVFCKMFPLCLNRTCRRRWVWLVDEEAGILTNERKSVWTIKTTCPVVWAVKDGAQLFMDREGARFSRCLRLPRRFIGWVECEEHVWNMLLARGPLEADPTRGHFFSMDDLTVILMLRRVFRDKGNIL